MARYPSSVMVTALCPWDDAERLDEPMFRRQVDHILASGFRHVYVFGTAGEGYAIDSDRFRRVVELFGELLLDTDASPMVGVIGLSTGNVLERIRIAHDLGFRSFQLSLPSWSVLSDKEVLRYFEAVCGAYPDSVFMHYNTAKSGRVVDGGLYRVLVERIPNLVATKIMSDDLSVVASAVSEAPELMHFLHEQSVAYGSLFGEVGLLGSYGALAPRKSWALLEAARAGDAKGCAEIGAWFARMVDDVLVPLMADRRVDGAYDKTVAKLHPALREFPLRMLSPYRTITDEEFVLAEQTLRERFPDCE
jgi:dihydrodipicolinate synthase/N-acetylneuraminate lyase